MNEDKSEVINEAENVKTTQSNRIVRIPSRYKIEINNIMIDNDGKNKIMFVGAGNIGYSGSTQDLHAMKEAMSTKDID
jgi:hypothetical protein